MGPIPDLNNEIVSSNMRATYIADTNQNLFRNCEFEFNCKKTSYPTIDIICCKTEKNVETVKNNRIVIKIEFIFSGKTYEKNIMC